MACLPAESDDCLEALVLRDGGGALFAVPVTVLARYRIRPDEREWLGIVDAGDGASGGPPPVAWRVAGGVYSPDKGEDA